MSSSLRRFAPSHRNSCIQLQPSQIVRRSVIVALAAATASAAGLGAQNPKTQPRTHTPQPTTAAITAADLKTRLYIFAADSMEGRETGTRGHIRATNYIASEFGRSGSSPWGTTARYFQNVPVIRRSLDPVVDDHGRRRDAEGRRSTSSRRAAAAETSLRFHRRRRLLRRNAGRHHGGALSGGPDARQDRVAIVDRPNAGRGVGRGGGRRTRRRPRREWRLGRCRDVHGRR